MEKDSNSGFLTNTIDSYTVQSGVDYIENVYFKEENEQSFIFLTLTTKDVEDWEYYGIFDLYNEEIFDGLVFEILDGSGEYNPRWILKIAYVNDRVKMEELINQIVDLHLEELDKIKPLLAENKTKYENMMDDDSEDEEEIED
jgi:hypothetical protein